MKYINIILIMSSIIWMQDIWVSHSRSSLQFPLPLSELVFLVDTSAARLTVRAESCPFQFSIPKLNPRFIYQHKVRIEFVNTICKHYYNYIYNSHSRHLYQVPCHRYNLNILCQTLLSIFIKKSLLYCFPNLGEIAKRCYSIDWNI